MKNILFIFCMLAVVICTKAQTRNGNDFAHGFSSGFGSAGNVSYTYGSPFSRQASSTNYNLSQGQMQAQLIRLDMELQGAQNDSLAVSPSHVQDTSGFFLGYDGEEIVFDGRTIHVFPAGHYDSTALDAAHYNWHASFNYDSMTTLVMDIWEIYELFDTLYLDSTEIVTDYASNELHIPAYAWHQLHGGPNLYKLYTTEHHADSLRHYFVNLCGGTIKDADGNEYASIYLGFAPQRYCWTKANLEATKYIGGADAPNMIYNSETHSNTAENLDTYGRLYNWYSAVNVPVGSDVEPTKTLHSDFVRGICPAGWHLPDSANLASLNTEDALDLMSDILWLEPGHDTGAGFYALPAGYYHYSTGRYEDMLGYTSFWSSVKHSVSECWVCSLLYGCNKVVTDMMSAENGASVRCVKDQIYDEDGNELTELEH